MALTFDTKEERYARLPENLFIARGRVVSAKAREYGVYRFSETEGLFSSTCQGPLLSGGCWNQKRSGCGKQVSGKATPSSRVPASSCMLERQVHDTEGWD